MTTPQHIEPHLPQLALQLVMERLLEEIAGSHLYSVVEPWQKAELQQHPDILIIRDANALEAAMATPETNLLYIPADAALTPSLTRTIVQRASLHKTILWEGAK